MVSEKIDGVGQELVDCISSLTEKIGLQKTICRPLAGKQSSLDSQELHNVNISVEIDDIVDDSNLDQLLYESGLWYPDDENTLTSNKKILDFIFDKTIRPHDQNVLYRGDMLLHSTWERYFKFNQSIGEKILEYDTPLRLRDTLEDYINAITSDKSLRYSRQYYISIWDKAKDEDLSSKGQSMLPSLLGVHIQLYPFSDNAYEDKLIMTVNTRSTDIEFLGNDLYFFLKLFRYICKRCKRRSGTLTYNMANLHGIITEKAKERDER